jgi:hypothetical protein
LELSWLQAIGRSIVVQESRVGGVGRGQKAINGPMRKSFGDKESRAVQTTVQRDVFWTLTEDFSWAERLDASARQSNSKLLKLTKSRFLAYLL